MRPPQTSLTEAALPRACMIQTRGETRDTQDLRTDVTATHRRYSHLITTLARFGSRVNRETACRGA